MDIDKYLDKDSNLLMGQEELKPYMKENNEWCKRKEISMKLQQQKWIKKAKIQKLK